jgi:spermidine synthase
MLKAVCFIAAALSLSANPYVETLHANWAQSLTIDEEIHREKTQLQDLFIFNNKTFGRVLTLDGVVQTTEADEAIYHEMMTHVPILAHGEVESVLIIGGGDGGILREALKHDSIKQVILVEIDSQVVERSKKYLPKLSNGAFDDPRAKVIIEDGAKYVKECTEMFDLIICDSTDPFGPGQVLFTSEFYGNCKALLNRGGVFVNQNGVPFLQPEELKLTLANRQPHFKHVTFYVAPIPTYVGGFMAFGWASDRKYRTSESTLEERLSKLKGPLFYYTPAIHKASFALPNYVIQTLIEKSPKAPGANSAPSQDHEGPFGEAVK